MESKPVFENTDKVAEDYYDSDSAFKYYTIIHSSVDYSGLGEYPEAATEKDLVTGKEYVRGAGTDSIKDANLIRDKTMLNDILNTMPDKKVKCLELGAGRGGLTRYIARELLKLDKLELMVGMNISEKENEVSRQKAKEDGIPEALYRVDHCSYDTMTYKAGTFDVVFSNESLLYAEDKAHTMGVISRLLTPGGALVITDILESPDADRSALAGVYARLGLPNLGDHVTYDRVFTQNGLTKKLMDCSAEGIRRHYGAVKYNATVAKKEELLKDGVTEEFISKQVVGLGKWIEAAEKGLLQRGRFVYKKAVKERSFIMIKPDGVQRGLVGQIIQRFETKGFKLAGMKLCMPGKEMFEKHYSDLSSKPFFPGLVEYAASGPVCCMVWEGANVVLTGRKMLGATKPFDSEPGTIRGDLCIDVGRNVIHGSDSVESANKEIDLWFKPEELVYWSDHSDAWVYE